MVSKGQIWRRKPPGRERVEVRRVWNYPEPLIIGGKQAITRCARCHPVRGGRPLVIPVADLEREYELEATDA